MFRLGTAARRLRDSGGSLGAAGVEYNFRGIFLIYEGFSIFLLIEF